MASLFIGLFFISFMALIAFFFLVILPLKKFTRHHASFGLIGAFAFCAVTLFLYIETAPPAPVANQDAGSLASADSRSITSSSSSSEADEKPKEGDGSLGWFLTVIIASVAAYYAGLHKGKNPEAFVFKAKNRPNYNPDRRLSKEDYDDLSDEEREALEEERQHLRDMAALDPRWYEGQTGKFAKFTYVDADGVVTERKIVKWTSADAYIEGFCLEKKAGRTFRKDRIEDWVSN